MPHAFIRTVRAFIFHPCRMLFGVGIVLLVLLELSSPGAVPGPCQCSTLRASLLRVNCSSQKLTEVPLVPVETEELHLQNNLMTRVPDRYFDTLQNLRMVSLSGNPFRCDCGIQYLRSWLLKNRALIPVMPTCASPDALVNKAIHELDNSDLSSCSPDHSCPGGVYNAILGFMLCTLIALLFWSLRLAKDLTYILRICEKHAGFEAESLKSRKPKHRRTVQRAADMMDELEQPLLNMEILPPITDVLRKKHNKIKEVWMNLLYMKTIHF